MAYDKSDIPELTDELKCALKDIISHFEDEDRFVRERQLRLWKKLKYFWNGFHRIWWSEVAHDWRIYDQELMNSDNAEFYDKPVNVFRAYLESIIAALSVTVPPITCAPDDPDNPADMNTAKAGNNISKLLYKHNDAPLMWVHALFVYCTEGMVAAYNYDDTDKKYGTYSKDKYKSDEEEQEIRMCSLCQSQLADPTLMNDEKYEFDPGDDDVAIKNAIADGKQFCPQCAEYVDPEIQKVKIPVQRFIGTTQEPKTRQCIDVVGGLNVKVPNYARCVEETPYLRYAYEVHYSIAYEYYPQLYDKQSGSWRVGPGESTGAYDDYERWARMAPQYYGDFPINTVTCREIWLRPAAFNVCTDEEKRDKLKKRFPDGVKCCFVNDEYVESCNESLDDHWTLTQNPLSDYLQYDPIGLLLTTIQEITNDLVSLVLQTIEHGIPQTFVDPAVVNLAAYRQQEVSPGDIFPARPKAGKSMSDAFYEVKTATLSAEVQPFAEKIQEMGQFVSGALPSLFGGAQPNSSKTAAQYSMSRAQALQRLQNAWKMLNFWWKDIFGKVIPQYIKCIKNQEDEHFAVKGPNNNFVKVVIHQSELEGNIGSVELEADDEIPITWSQRKDVAMQLLQSANPEMMAAIMDPENLPLFKAAVGLDDFVIPGEDDRIKQYEEIQELLESTPMPPGPDGQPQPSVPIDPVLDNHKIESDICRRWLISDIGRTAKTDNPEGYQNVLLHYKDHMQALLQSQAQQAAQAPPPANQPNNKQPAKQPAMPPKSQATGVGVQDNG